jgi:cysteine desulfurase/selenocysteine lyase
MTEHLVQHRDDFPILNQDINGKPLVYFDNAASTQKPRRVVDAISEFYASDYANVHRGVHQLSQRATIAYEAVREKVRKFINASDLAEIINVSGTTGGLNLLAHSLGEWKVRSGDDIIVSAMEHHSNIVPWQMLCERTGATLKVIPMDTNGVLDINAFKDLLSDRTRIVSVVHVSNALGTVNDIKTIIDLAHEFDALAVIDGAQAVAHIPVDVQALDCDFYVFSGHKLYGPTGVGIVYGKKALLQQMPPYQGGGDMILSVSFEKTTYNELPYKFEAGTPNIADVVGLGAAIDYISEIGIEAAAATEADLLQYATEQINGLNMVTPIGTASQKASVLSFVIDNVHPHDAGTIFDTHGIAIRAGHHCAQPVMEFFGVPATIRASFAFYNTRDEVDRMIDVIPAIHEVFS